MLKNILIFLILVAGFGCVEKYDFTVPNGTEGVVIEASISNQSYSSTLNYPSDGRYFSVKLSRTSDVTNTRGEYISEANVQLFSDQGDSWTYDEDNQSAGTYYLHDADFAAEPGFKYQLRITTPSGDAFESAWETMPVAETLPGTVSVKETTHDTYQWRSGGEKVLQTYDGLNVKIKVPENETDEAVYYRWNFQPIWLYTAPEADFASPVKKCWVRSPHHLKEYALQKEIVGGYDKQLFFVRTTGNDRMYEYFSVLIIQSSISEEYYYFWNDLLAQSEKGGLYDQPPFNLLSNFTAINNTKTVNGYFGVVTENATRWVFDKNGLSYGLYDDIAELCLISYGPPLPGEPDACEDCRAYSPGDAVNFPPAWW